MQSTESTPRTDGPLSGYLVVDLSRALAGPHAGMMLADLGARVIKVENPGTGDDTRGWGPPFVGPEDDPQATYFLSCNRNKESIALDLKNDDGRTVLRELLERADVVIENFRPGVLDRLGFSAAEMHALNPALVILSITGFGHDGPESRRSGYDQILQGEAGLMSLTGSGPDDPQRVGVPIADLLSGMYGAFGTLAALLQRERTGQGQIVRTSLLAALIGVHAFQGTRATVAGEVPKAQGNHHPSIAPYGLFHCADGLLQIAVGSEGLWRRLAAEYDLPIDAAGFATNAQRVRNRDAVVAETRDGQDHKRRVQRVHLRGREAEPVQDSGPEVLDDHVRPFQQFTQHRPAVVALQVQCDGFLVAVARQEVGGLGIVLRPDERRPPAARVVPGARAFYLDDPCAEVCQHHPGVRSCQGAAQVHHEVAGEGTRRRRH